MERLGIDLTKYLENSVLIHHKSDGTTAEIKYKELYKQIVKIGLVLESENLKRGSDGSAIGIVSTGKHPSKIALLLVALEADFAFCFISKADVPHNLNNLGIKYIFSDEPLATNSNHLTLRNTLEVLEEKIYLFKSEEPKSFRIFNDLGDPMNRICYTIMTSGTTGQRKIVRVTYKCIATNLDCLQKIFRLNKDVIYSSAPCTFDVFVLDVFIALYTGSALVIVDEVLRYSEESLDFLFSPKSNGITFLQMTPSLFQQYGTENIRNKILHSESSLK